MRGGTAFSISGGITALAAGGNLTVALPSLIAPSEGATVVDWGMITDTAGTGTATYSCTLRKRGGSVDLSQAVIFDLDGAQYTLHLATSAGISKSGFTRGDYLDMYCVDDGVGTHTGDAVFKVWVLWRL